MIGYDVLECYGMIGYVVKWYDVIGYAMKCRIY